MKPTFPLLLLVLVSLSFSGCDNPWKKAEALEAKVKSQEAELAKVGEEKQVLEQEYSEYREKYRIAARKLAEGERIGSLITKDGTEYLDVVITRVDAEYVNFTHSTGAGRAALGEMPDNWQERFDYEPVQTVTGSPTPDPAP